MIAADVLGTAAAASVATSFGAWLNGRRKERRDDKVTAESGWANLTTAQRAAYDEMIAGLRAELSATRDELAAARAEFRQYREESAAETAALRAELQSYREQAARMQLLEIEKETKPR